MVIPLIGLLVLSIAPIGRRIDRRRPAQAPWARLMTWVAAFLVVLSAGIIGSAIGVTFKSFEALLLFGLVPWARFGAIAGLLAGFAGIAAVIQTIRAQIRYKLPVGTLLGLLLTGLTAISFAAFLLNWDLGPF